MRWTESQVKAHQLKMGKTVEIETRSLHEIEFENQLNAHDITGWVTEYEFSPTRKWRFDFAWVDQKIGVEIEGIVIDGRGRHQTPQGYTLDCEKYNAATLAGFQVYRFVPQMLASGMAIEQVKMALGKVK